MSSYRVMGLAGLFCVWLLGIGTCPAQAEQKESSLTHRIEDTAKKVGNKIEQGFTKAATKLKEKKVGEKIEQKLEKAARKTAEGFRKAGDKIDQKLNH